MKNLIQFCGIVRAKPRTFLNGGVTVVKSSPFDTFAEASAWIAGMQQKNAAESEVQVSAWCQASHEWYTLRAGQRVQLCPHTDNWMRGARFGIIISVDETIAVKLDKITHIARGYSPEDMRPA